MTYPELMVAVRWEAIGRETYEDLVGVLLSRVYQARRIDGQGGDGGRDAEILIDGRVELFEFKFFHGRLSREKGRRAQVERSLARAAERNPSRWSLIVPIIFTDGEHKWFEGLGQKYPFPLELKDRTWLESTLADHPSVVRFYTQSGHEDALNALVELRKEQAVLGAGVSDLIVRLRVLRQRMAESDPHYRLDISLQGDTTTIAVVPAYPGAEEDWPIYVRPVFKFQTVSGGAEAAQRLRDALDFGETTEIPAEFVEAIHVQGLRGVEQFAPSGLIIGPSDVDQNVELVGRLFVETPDGTTLGSLPIRFRERRLGMRGGILSGTDATGLIQVRIKFATDLSAQVSVSFSPPEEATPGMVLPALRVLQHMASPNVAWIELAGLSVGEPMPLPGTDPVPASLVELLEDLDRIQAYARTSFAIPDEFTRADVSAIRQAARLISGERVPIGKGPITASILPTSLGQIRKILEEGSSYAFAFSVKEHRVAIAGVDVPLGPATAHVRSAMMTRIPQPDSLTSIDSGDDVAELSIELTPTDDAAFELQLQSRLETDAG